MRSDRSQTRPLLFLGAGATAAFTQQKILTSDLLDKAFRNTSLDDHTRQLRDFFREIRLPESFVPTIDEVLSVIDKAMEQNLPLCRSWTAERIRRLRRDITRLVIETVRNATGSDNPKNECAALTISSLVRFMPHAWIVTLNWDCIVEQTLAKVGINVFDGSLSYRLPISNYLGRELLAKDGALTLLKPHGSVNWGFCPICLRMMCYHPDEKAELHSSCSRCDTSDCIEPILVAPTSIEQNIPSPVAGLWYHFEEIVAACTHITFVGYSLPPQDINLRFHLLRGLIRRRELPVVEVIERKHESNGEVRKRYGMYFGEAFTFSALPDGLRGRLSKDLLFH